MLLDNKIAVVTGGGRGIGKAIVRHYLDEGASVIAFDIGGDRLEKLEREIAAPGRLLTVAGDVTRRSDVETLLAAAMSRFGRVDVVVNNAGIARFEPFMSVSFDTWRTTFAVNVDGMHLCCRVFAEQMIRQRSGVFVNMSSINGMVGEAGMSHYNASKAAVLLLSRTIANELAAHGIRSNAICPGYIWTELSHEAGVGDQFVENYAAKIPAGRLGTPMDVAYAAAFLASDRASFITGTELVVDGGQIGVV